MALITRIGRLFCADFHAVLDKIEEPDILLKQALREMEEIVAKDIHRSKFYAKEQARIELKINETEENIKKVDLELDICFSSNENDLAKNQVKRKLQMQLYEKHLHNKNSSIKIKNKELDKKISENKNKLLSMQQKLELLMDVEDKCEVDNINVTTGYNPNISITDADVQVAFLRESQARSSL